jgi:hypothetical protein
MRVFAESLVAAERWDLEAVEAALASVTDEERNGMRAAAELLLSALEAETTERPPSAYNARTSMSHEVTPGAISVTRQDSYRNTTS